MMNVESYEKGKEIGFKRGWNSALKNIKNTGGFCYCEADDKCGKCGNCLIIEELLK